MYLQIEASVKILGSSLVQSITKPTEICFFHDNICWGPKQQERRETLGAGPEEGHYDDQRAGAPLQ